jgi:hypothetical protein
VKRKRHTTEQIIRKLREAEEMRATGKTIGEVCQGQVRTWRTTDARPSSAHGSVHGFRLDEPWRMPSSSAIFGPLCVTVHVVLQGST